MSFQWTFPADAHGPKRGVLGEREALELVRERAEEAGDVDRRARAGHHPDEAGPLLDGDGTRPRSHARGKPSACGMWRSAPSSP